MDKEGVSGIKASIITVSYNSVDTIERTIQSVLKQSYQNIEYIIIDGLSTDGTQQIIEKYKDRIAYYISEKDDGLYDAMNKGIQIATGEIIGIINSDDWYAESVIEDVVDYFLQSEADLIYGKIINVLQDKEVQENWQIPLDHMWYEMAVPHPSVFVKKKIYEQLGIFNTAYKLAADYELLLRFYSKKVKFNYFDKVIAYFRSGGVSETRRKESIDEVYNISVSYADKSPDKCYIKTKIDERHEWAYFCEEIFHVNATLYRLLCEYFHETITEIIIFGTGFWGEICYKCMTDNDVIISYFIDNNALKWNMTFCGVKVLCPNELQYKEAFVLIAIKEYGEKVKKQLLEQEKSRLKCVSIKELEELYRKNNMS